MIVRAVDQWKEILGGMPATEAAARILGDIVHYHHDRAYENRDIQELANAIEAWRELGSEK